MYPEKRVFGCVISNGHVKIMRSPIIMFTIFITLLCVESLEYTVSFGRCVWKLKGKHLFPLPFTKCESRYITGIRLF